jgi:predicted nucleic acid-binding protein
MGWGPGENEAGSLILVDSSVWIDYFNGISKWQTNFLDRALSSQPIVMGDLILTEVLQGFRSDKDFETAHSFLKELPFKQMGGYQVAVQSADNYRSLRKAGITVRKTIDVIIATFCIAENLPLLHDNRDFDPIATHFPLKLIAEKN